MRWVADPNRVVQYVASSLLECLTCALFEDVLKATGGGPIDMDELLTPLTPADDERARGAGFYILFL
jgi:hypothetical protein